MTTSAFKHKHLAVQSWNTKTHNMFVSFWLLWCLWPWTPPEFLRTCLRTKALSLLNEMRDRTVGALVEVQSLLFLIFRISSHCFFGGKVQKNGTDPGLNWSIEKMGVRSCGEVLRKLLWPVAYLPVVDCCVDVRRRHWVSWRVKTTAPKRWQMDVNTCQWFIDVYRLAWWSWRYLGFLSSSLFFFAMVTCVVNFLLQFLEARGESDRSLGTGGPGYVGWLVFLADAWRRYVGMVGGSGKCSSHPAGRRQ